MAQVSDAAANLKRLRERARVPVRDFAARLGMSSGGYKHYEDRYKKPYLPRDFAAHVARELEKEGVNPAEVMALAGDESGALPADTGGRVARVPVYDVRASAGGGLIPDGYVAILEEIEIEERYLREVLKVRPENALMITVDGDSMEPTFRNNDVVIIDISKNSFSVDGLYVLTFDDTLLVKRLSRTVTADHLLIISDNKDKYPAHELPLERLKVIGRVMGALLKM